MIFDFQIPLEAVKKTNLGHIVMNFAQQPINISTYFMTFHRELYSKSFSNHFVNIRGIFEVQTSQRSGSRI